MKFKFFACILVLALLFMGAAYLAGLAVGYLMW